MTNRTFESAAGPPGYDFPPLDVSARSDGASALIVAVSGELDLATAPILRRHLESYNGLPKSNGHPRRIIYHLSELRFMDATGLTALLTAIDGHGRHTITVREPSPLVRRVLDLVGLASIIENADQESHP